MSGAHGLAGEIAFLPLGVDPLQPGTRSTRGSLEEAASVDAMLSVAGARRPFTGIPELMEAARLGDPAAKKAVENESRLIAYALSSLILIVDPPLVVLTGSVGLLGGPEFARTVRNDLARLLPVNIPSVEASAAGELATLQGAQTKGIELAWDLLVANL